jgi:hypothetical protein
MTSPIVTLPGESTWSDQQGAFFPGDEREQFVESPEHRRHSGRGALTGVLLGAGLWAVILTATGVIKL